MSQDEKVLEVSRTGPLQEQPKRFFTSFGRAFMFGTRQVCLATEQIGGVRPDGTVMSRKIIVDAKTHEPITFLDTGTHVLEQGPDSPATYAPVYEQEQQSTALTIYADKLCQLKSVGHARLLNGEWVASEKGEETY